jgi:ubiquinone/menaquinone biosynthesis C-methylase UbiE
MTDDLTAAPTGNSDLVATFLQNVRGATPLSIEQIEVMLQLLTAARGSAVENFLDLGCGDGMLSAAILDEFPNARGCLVDISEPLVNAARHQLQAHAGRVDLIVADYTQPGWAGAVARLSPFDAVVSAFAAPGSPDHQKRELYAEIFQLLKPEGPFVNIEQVASATRWTESIWDDYLIEAIFGPEIKGASGKKRVELTREYYRRANSGGNISAPLEVQCDWLREIGFENVECYLKVAELAVFGGQRPAGD